MLYRENGQFKTSYRADQQIFPIAQDRIAIGHHPGHGLHRRAHAGQRLHLPRHPDPFVIMALAALGVNILVGYCGQISLGLRAPSWPMGAYGPTTSSCAFRACR